MPVVKKVISKHYRNKLVTHDTHTHTQLEYLVLYTTKEIKRNKHQSREPSDLQQAQQTGGNLARRCVGKG